MADITTSNGVECTRTRGSSFSQARPKVLRPFNADEVKILLLENVNATAIEAFKKQGYQVNTSFSNFSR
jgi:D-3-phosphoglycerate dehydrogenase